MFFGKKPGCRIPIIGRSIIVHDLDPMRLEHFWERERRKG
jgi:hypothetical protein